MTNSKSQAPDYGLPTPPLRSAEFNIGDFRNRGMLDAGFLLACAACYGQSDSPLAQGMNWGILSLLGVVVFVLGAISTFFVYLGKKSASTLREPEAESKTETTSKD